MLLLFIRLYQKLPIANHTVRQAVRLHHRLRKPETRPCPYAREAGGCSEHFARQVKVVGSVAALSGALAAMSVCGPGDVFSPDCKPQPHAGTDSDWCAPKPGDCIGTSGIDAAEWCISSGPSLMPKRGGDWPDCLSVRGVAGGDHCTPQKDSFC